jgi:poly(ADP-ribose) glycohydrolase
MGIYRPFSAERRAQLLALLPVHHVSIEQLGQLRQDLASGALAGLRSLVADEPGLGSRLQERILPCLVRHARALMAAEPSLLTHEGGRAARTVVPRAEVAGWLAHMFLGTLPPPSPAHPELDFAPLLSARWPAELAKLRCVLTYFDRIAEATPRGRLTIERLVAAGRTAAQWAAEPSPLLPLTVDAEGSIEDAHGCRQVDFANRYLGGGVLSGGCVQEEIRFAVAPELCVAMIASPVMQAEEAIVVYGAERFAQTQGYAQSLQHVGPFADPCARAEDGTPDIELVAIDAVDYRRRDATAQYTEAVILRELGKARSGFLRDARGLPIASGNWGCGAFGGDPPLKAVLQWLAASAEGRALRYFSFGDRRVGDLASFAATVRERQFTVGGLFQRLLAVCSQGRDDLYPRLLTT